MDLAVLVLLGIGCSSSEDDGDASRRKCVQLREHLVDVRLKDVTNVDAAAYRAVMARSLGDRFVTECIRDLSELQIKCALAATDSASVTACSSSK